MKTLFMVVCLSALTGIATAQLHKNSPGSPPKNLDENWLSKAKQYLQQQEYEFRHYTDPATKILALNSAQRLGFEITHTGFKVSPVHYRDKDNNEWEQYIDIVKFTKGDMELKLVDQSLTIRDGSHLVIDHQGFKIEYINNEKGLRQNFIINEKLEGNGKLEAILHLSGDLFASVDNNELVFKDKNDVTQFFYRDLTVWDANQQPLNAIMELREDNTLAIVVDDENAEYPVTIDPLNQTPAWATSADGILPGLVGQLAINAAYGFSVAGLGDVNGDGFDDVAVGAPAMVDIITGSGSLASVGGVFVYFGSATGLPVVPSAKLQPTTVVAGALFGYSIAGGDINNDGKNDILVGAPLDRITISTGGSSTASGNVGKVYVFSGATLTTNTSPFITLQLNGNGILENGVNLSVKALFGFSVAVTEDLNGDGKKDMIVGAPTYAGIKIGLLGTHLLDVRSGGAFVFLTKSGGNNSTTLVKLEPIKQSLLGLGLLSENINGLLFGYAVDGLGDYNNDGKADVVATAPAGIDASSISALLVNRLLQGSAIVYYGTGTSVNTDPGAVLAATSGGLLTNLIGTVANVANLFGTSVRGVRSATGARNGNVLVGAPLGSTLINVLNLQLKTGTVSVFKKKSSSPNNNVTPDQVLSSPRNSNNILELIQSNLLFGYSLDNTLDVNCDGIADIVVGEPISSGVQLLNANVAGGAAYVYLGVAGGSYQSSPAWTLTAYEDEFLGINATSLIGYSVAGAGKVKGSNNKTFVLVGSPSRTLDFGSGLLNLGNTLGTLFSLVAGNNGVGKAYLFDTKLCDLSPNAVNDAVSTNEDSPVNGNASSNDTPGDGTNTWSLVGPNGGAANGTVSMNPDGTFTYTPAPNFNGTDVFTYQVCDEDADCDTATVTVTVNPTDDVPLAANDAASTNEDTPVSGNVTGNDTPSADGGNIWTIVSNPSHGTVSMNADGTYTYTPAANYNGTDVFTYQLCDADGDCSTATVTITINPVNDSPVAVNDVNTTTEDTPVNGNVATNDNPSGDGGNIWTIVSNPSHGTVTMNPDGSYTYTPAPNYNGPDQFTYKLCDANNDCSEATVSITVNPANDVPTAVNDVASVNEDAQLNGNVSTNDTPSADCANTWTIVSNPSHGTVTMNSNGTYTYTPTANYNGPDQFTYKLCDCENDCSQATVSITVNPVNDVPTAVNDAASVNEDAQLNGNVSTNDTPSPDCANTWSIVSNPSHGTVTMNPNGTYTYTPTANYNGPDQFTYKLCDCQNDCSTAVVNITVNPANDLPVAIDDVNNTNQNTPVNGNAASNDTPSPDGGNTWSLVGVNGGAGHGTVTMNTNGTYTYTPATGYSGTDAFTYQLCDANGDCVTATVTIAITSPCSTDTTPPTIVCPSNKTIVLGSNCTAALTDYRGEAIVNDNCPGTITISQSPAPGTILSGIGNTTVTLTATDAKGNTANCSFTVTRVDQTAPTIICPGNKTLALGANCTLSMPDYRSQATASDNCGNPVVTQSPAAGTILTGAGTTTATLTATDASGNISTCTFTVTRADQTAPVLTCASNQTIDCNATVTFGSPAASDNCGQPSVVVVSTTTTQSGSSTIHTRTWKATDAAGNSTTCSQSITQTSCAGGSGHIYPTSTSCNTFLNGTAQPLAQLCYAYSANKVTNITPGVFFYFTTFTAPSASFTVNVVQSNSCGFKPFTIQQGKQIYIYSLGCGTLVQGTQTTEGQGSITFNNATPGAQYVISVKYDSKSVQGSLFTGSAPVCQYNFECRIGGALINGTQGSINLVPNCSSSRTTTEMMTKEESGSGIEATPQLSFFPNPAADFINLSFASATTGHSSITLHDINGKVVTQIHNGITEAGKLNQRRLTIRNLAGGLYMIRFQHGEFVETKKLVIAK